MRAFVHKLVTSSEIDYYNLEKLRFQNVIASFIVAFEKWIFSDKIQKFQTGPIQKVELSKFCLMIDETQKYSPSAVKDLQMLSKPTKSWYHIFLFYFF